MADEITQADRELLAAEYERKGSASFKAYAKSIRTTQVDEDDNHPDTPALRAIAAARRQGQAPRLAMPDHIGLYQGPDDCPHLQINDVSMAVFPAGSWPEVCDALDSITGSTAPPSAPVGVEARKRSAAELQKFIDLADDYDLDDCAIGALEAGIAALAQQPAPVAPVGVEAMPGLRRSLAKIVRLDEGEPVWIEPNEAEAILAALAQQPAPSPDVRLLVELVRRLVGDMRRTPTSWTEADKALSYYAEALEAVLARFTAAQQEGAP